MSAIERAARIVPAQLAFLAIYNPSLGKTDETFRDQLVFYYSRAVRDRRKGNPHSDSQDADYERERCEDENEKLRQIGLAQGMVGFARSFSDGDAVESVETEQSRIIMHELEEGWWILASIDLTRLPATSSTSNHASPSSPDPAPPIEHSAREVSPPQLLLQHLLRAHDIFGLHHGPSLGQLFQRLGRARFCGTLEKFWTRFATDWDVLLHSSPAVDIFGGLKLAAGGELGIGVGEEEWGSGEREVLEDFAGRTEGLVDLLVSRFGEPATDPAKPAKGNTATARRYSALETVEPWMGCGHQPGAADGVLFSGVGAVARSSLRDISSWIEWIYTYGEHAYGVRDNPTSGRAKRRRKPRPDPSDRRLRDTHRGIKSKAGFNQDDNLSSSVPTADQSNGAAQNAAREHSNVPPPIVAAAEKSLVDASSAVGRDTSRSDAVDDHQPASEGWMKYMTLGYGYSWGYSSKRPNISRQPSHQGTKHKSPDDQAGPGEAPPLQYLDPEPHVDKVEKKLRSQILHENTGHFLVGLQGDLGDEDDGDWESGHVDSGFGDDGNRLLLRTLHVEVDPQRSSSQEEGTYANLLSGEDTPTKAQSSQKEVQRFRVIVYVHRPFIYTFLFNAHTESLSMPSFYHHLHSYLSPLQRLLTASTDPTRVAARIRAASSPHTTAPADFSTPNNLPIFDLVFDPHSLTVHSSIPNIPEPGTFGAEGLGGLTGEAADTELNWTRVEALNVHSQILATLAETRRQPHERERTCKTAKGWWVVWMRLPSSPPPIQAATRKRSHGSATDSAEVVAVESMKEAFLVRRARDAVTDRAKSVGSRMGSGMFGLGPGGSGAVGGGAAAGWGPARLAEGIGIDPRRYIEGLLSLNR